MNYFGHAAVASWRSAEPAIALGAMLPDFATMCRAKLPTSPDARITAGIALHHQTDAAFHHLPVVTALMRELDERLERGGCARGPRRAVAHVGMELLLDGTLVTEPAYRASYLAAIADDSPITWSDVHGHGEAARFAVVLARLRAYGVPDDLRDPEAITQRLARILAGRPLIEPSIDDLRAIRTALTDHAPRLAVAADTVMRGMRAAID